MCATKRTENAFKEAVGWSAFQSTSVAVFDWAVFGADDLRLVIVRVVVRVDDLIVVGWEYHVALNSHVNSYNLVMVALFSPLPSPSARKQIAKPHHTSTTSQDQKHQRSWKVMNVV